MEKDSLYIDLNDWIQNYHPELTQSKIEMIKDILEELHINEEDEIHVSGDYILWGYFCNYLLDKSRTQ